MSAAAVRESRSTPAAPAGRLAPGSPPLHSEASRAESALEPQAAFPDPHHVAALFAVDPAGLGGILVKASAGPQRDLFLRTLQDLLPAGTPALRVPLAISDDRLLGGLDLPATLAAGRPVAMRGLLAAAHDGVVILPMAERLAPATAARIAAVLDAGEVATQRDGLAIVAPARFGVIALDEGDEGVDEAAPASLCDRMAFAIHLGTASRRTMGDDAAALLVSAQDVSAARALLPNVTVSDEAARTLCAVAASLGIGSLRPPTQALHAARCAAALDGRTKTSDDDIVLAAQLVLAPRAVVWPQDLSPEETGPEPEAQPNPDDGPEPERSEDPAPEPPDADHQPPDDDAQDSTTPESLADRVVAATRAALPAKLLAMLAPEATGRAGAMGKAGASVITKGRGRAVGVRQGQPGQGARVHLLATLRAALGWQRLRKATLPAEHPALGRRVHIRRDDLHVVRTEARSPSLVVFAVDASGSLALHRLGETKGAIELLLSDCYARRDEVALVAFSGRGTEVILPPTRSLVRARRQLAGLPAGGGTPLASGIEAALDVARAARARGRTPLLVVLTDGQANLTRDKSPGRARAGEEALAAARFVAASRIPALLIDVSQRPQPAARAISEAMSARYLPLPRADAYALSQAVRTASLAC